MAEQKQHEASEKKLRDSRKQGKIAKSATVTQCCGATGVLLGVIFTMQASWVESQSLIELTFTRGFTLPSTLIVSWATLCAEILVIGFVIGGCIALVVEFLQTGFLFEISLVSPKASRINPVEGIKRIFGNLKRIWDPLLRCCFVLVIFSFFLNSIWKELVWTSWLDTNGQVKKVCQLATDCTLVFLFGYIALAIGDYFLQKK
ncbi:MAG: EscU/YscU/HrcU family type III secretion system export apparatus switch protein, partial [Bdellovibrionales bacterium]|nr:EscU/YscU/HrcU family type III secretion system export apparatus switch protein [Bdellovibrionales bacterium]